MEVGERLSKEEENRGLSLLRSRLRTESLWSGVTLKHYIAVHGRRHY